MNPRTTATLDHLRSVEWFRSVGVHDVETPILLNSWTEAIESCRSPEWEDLCLEAANQFRERLVERSRERFSTWNDVVVEVKPFSMALVREKTKKTVEDNHLPKEFIQTVDWDILHLCMESEFADVYPPGFYASQAFWYKKGHFPCGWRGDFPNGRPVIY